MNKQPKLMDVSRMRDIFKTNFAQISDHVFFSNELAMIHGDPLVFRLIIQQTPPLSSTTIVWVSSFVARVL